MQHVLAVERHVVASASAIPGLTYLRPAATWRIAPIISVGFAVFDR